MAYRPFLRYLASQFKSRQDIITEIINLNAILNLPKGTEHFVSDVHGEYDAFNHVLRNGSGSVRGKIDDLFGKQLKEADKQLLATIIAYPEEKLALIEADRKSAEDLNTFYAETIDHLIDFTRFCAIKYTRSKVRKALPDAYQYIIEELLYCDKNIKDKASYYHRIIADLIQLGQGKSFITSLSFVIQRLVIDHLHVVGDIYDRGPYPDKIMEALIHYHSLDIQWGNHDMLWMAAYAGSKVCLANVVRICARYQNLGILEDAYGINLRPLFLFAEKYYDVHPAFVPKSNAYNPEADQDEMSRAAKLQRAMAVIQFKLEGHIINRRPEFKMADRNLLSRIDFKKGEIEIEGKIHPIDLSHFPTVDPDTPLELTKEEAHLMDGLLHRFQNSPLLKKHMDFLFQKGDLYTIYNGNLLLHGCIPMEENRDYMSVTLEGHPFKGRTLMDQYREYVFYAYRHPEETDDYATDVCWYLWTGEGSTLFGKRAMKTFERYYIDDKSTHVEDKNPYYAWRNSEEFANKIFWDFGLIPEDAHLINGHTPVQEIKGESPIKANGKVIVIDGGFSRAYQSKTGVAGYTLLYNSYGLQIATHKPFTSRQEAVKSEIDVLNTRRVVDHVAKRRLVRDTTIGQQLQEQLSDLEALLDEHLI